MMEKETISLDGRINAVMAESGAGKLAGHAAALADLLTSDGRSVFARARLGSGLEATVLAAAAAWLAAEPGRKALVLVPGEKDVAPANDLMSRFAERMGFSCAGVARERDSGDTVASVAVGALSTILQRADEGTLDLSGYGLLVAHDLDALQREGTLGNLASRPGAGRIALLASPGTGDADAAAAAARALCDDPAELFIEEAGERAKALPSATWYVSADDKVRLALGELARDPARPVAVFCNLRAGAEETAGRLKANGLSVDYILGNLPRKAAILQSVLEGRIEVLVLTDEGADGLDGSWAKRLYNWDLPLEGEPYVKRLSVLDPAAEGARVVNFACDRYAMGLPAIGRHLGSALEAVQADPALFAAEDRSAGMDFSRRGDRSGDRPAQRNGPGRADGRRGDGQPGNGGRGGREPAREAADERRNGPEGRRDGRGQRRRGEPESRRYDGGRYDGRNAKSIMADIAALTGGRTDKLSGAGPATPAEGGRQPRAGDGAAREGNGGGKPGKRQGRRGGRRGGQERQPEARPAQEARGERRPRGDGAAGNQGQRPGRHQGDPYAVSMEERMRLYRERYGAGVSGKPSGEGKGRTGRRRGGSGRSGQAGKPEGARNGGSEPAAGPSRERTSRPPRQDRPARTGGTAEARVDQDAGKRPEGILGAIRGLFGKKKGD